MPCYLPSPHLESFLSLHHCRDVGDYYIRSFMDHYLYHCLDGYMLFDAFMLISIKMSYYSSHLVLEPLSFLKDGTEAYSLKHTSWLLLYSLGIYCLILMIFLGESYIFFFLREYDFDAFIWSWNSIFHYCFEFWNLLFSLPTYIVEFGILTG